MKYFIATVLIKGKKEEFPIYAEDKKEANKYAKLKLSGIIIKIAEAEEPLDAQFKRFKTSFMQNIKKRKI
ncbi:MAG: type II secretion system F family protein, partial [Sulfurimonas sp.]|nr:type II secretion system F family protein [Sulfurimonas sp.]